MTNNHQIAIDLMNEITVATQPVARAEAYDRLFKHLILHFSPPPLPKGPKDTPEYQHWLSVAKDLWQTWELSSEQQEAGLLESPTPFTVPSTFAMVLMRTLIKVRGCVVEVEAVPSFLDFHKTFRNIIMYSFYD
jgi:hypothetical protein